MIDNDMLWRQVDKDIELYKFYLEILIKAAMVIFAITGGITSYCLAHDDSPLMAYSLLLPIILNTSFSLICFMGLAPAKFMVQGHIDICENNDALIPYDFTPLIHVLYLFISMYTMVAIGLFILFITKIFSFL